MKAMKKALAALLSLAVLMTMFITVNMMAAAEPFAPASDFTAVGGGAANDVSGGVELRSTGTYEFGQYFTYNKKIAADGLTIKLDQMNLGSTAANGSGQGGIAIWLSSDATRASGIIFENHFNLYGNATGSVKNSNGTVYYNSDSGAMWSGSGGVVLEDLTLTLAKNGDHYTLTLATAKVGKNGMDPVAGSIAIDIPAADVEALFANGVTVTIASYFQNPVGTPAEAVLRVTDISPEYVAPEKPDKSALQAAVDGALTDEELAGYTEETAAAYKAAVLAAGDVLANENATAEEIAAAVKAIADAKAALTVYEPEEPSFASAEDFTAVGGGTAAEVNKGVELRSTGTYEFGQYFTYNKKIAADGLTVKLDKMNLSSTAYDSTGQGGIAIWLSSDESRASGLCIENHFNVYGNAAGSVKNSNGAVYFNSDSGAMWSVNGGVPVDDLTVTLAKNGDHYTLTLATDEVGKNGMDPVPGSIAIDIPAVDADLMFANGVTVTIATYFQYPVAVPGEAVLRVRDISPEYVAPEKPDKSALQAAVDGALTDEELAGYTEETVAAYKAAVAAAGDVLANENATAEEIAAAVKAIADAKAALTVKQPEPAFKNGDLDGDKNITSTDARLALQISVSKIKAEAVPNPDAADVDGDGKITSTDARLLLQVSVGKISERQLPVNLEPGAVFAGDFRAISGTVSNAEHGVQFKGSGSYDFGSGAVYNKTVKADGLRIFLDEMNLGTTACQNKGQGGLLICLTRDGTQATDGLRIQLDFNVYSNTVLNVTNQAGETLAQSNDGLFWRNINGGVPTRDLTVTLKKDGDKYLLSFLTASRSYPSIYPQTDGISVTYELDAGKVEAAFGGEEIGFGLFPYFQNPTAVVAESTLVIGSIGNITEG